MYHSNTLNEFLTYFICFLFWTCALYGFYYQRSFVKQGKIIKGKVIRIKNKNTSPFIFSNPSFVDLFMRMYQKPSGEDYFKNCIAVIEYKDEKSKKRKLQEIVDSKINIGDEINLRYAPKHRQKIRADNQKNIYFWPIIFLVVAIHGTALSYFKYG